MGKEEKNYYMVLAKCGHVGRAYFIPITFDLIAKNGKEAAKLVRYFPRVKHNHKDAILFVRYISFEEYLQINENNDKDPYLKCHSKREQKLIENFSKRLVLDMHNIKKTYDKNLRRERIAFKFKKEKILKKSLCQEDYMYAF